MIDLVESFKQKHDLPEELKWMEDVQYLMPESISELEYLLDQYKDIADRRIGMDTETSSLKIRTTNLVGISISPSRGIATYIPLHHDNYPNLNKIEVFEKLKEFFQDKTAVFFNASFDTNVLKYQGFYDLFPDFVSEDAMIAVYLDNTNEKEVFLGLKPSVQRYLNIQMIEFDEVVESDDPNFQLTDPRVSGAYAAADADMTLRLSSHLEPVWAPDGKETFIWKLENKIIDVLRYMEENTVLLDTDKIDEYIHGMVNDLLIMENRIYELAGRSFNISSPLQVAEVLYDDIGLKPPSLTDTGRRAANKNALSKLEGKHPIVGLIRSYNLTKKNLQNYLLKVRVYIDEYGPEARLNFNSIRTTSGRFASSGSMASGKTPLNAQNIPAADKFIKYRAKEILNVDDLFTTLGHPIQMLGLTEEKAEIHKKLTRKRRKRKKKKVAVNE